MRVRERSLLVRRAEGGEELLDRLSAEIQSHLSSSEVPVRFVVSSVDGDGYHCELAILEGVEGATPQAGNLLESRVRPREASPFNVALVIPTGMGLETGGHAGDANRVVKLLAACCDSLITHPNAVNAADINEMPTNCLYVEGSLLSRFLMGTLDLRPVRSNRVLVIVDDLRGDGTPREKLFTEAAVNSVSAAQATLGMRCAGIVTLRESIEMTSSYSPSRRAVGEIRHLERLFAILDEFHGRYDAVALTSVVHVEDDVFKAYFAGDLPNPWGGVEAMLTHSVASHYAVPTAHSPMLESIDQMNADVGIVDPRMAAEAVTLSALHCVLKGLHQAPGVTSDVGASSPSSISVGSVACLVTPSGCFGIPHLAALVQQIPVVAVQDEGCAGDIRLEEFPFTELHVVDNYLEAAGVVTAIRAGIAPHLVSDPLPHPSSLTIER